LPALAAMWKAGRVKSPAKPWMVRTLLASALAAAALLAPRPAAAAVRDCDGGKAVEAARAATARESLDVSTLQLVVEGPYSRARFVRTHPTFPPSPALKRKLAKRSFYFVWFHPPFNRSLGSRGTDVWALVDDARCEVLHLSRGR
jgi:hypothetical protein